MFPAFIIRAVTLVAGYVYPGYQCFKSLRRRRADVRELTFWCRYWVLLAILTTVQYFADPFFLWIPMYPEAKLALVIFLWHPQTLGADYMYDTFLMPLLSKYESDIDKHLKALTEQGQAAGSQLWRQGCMQAKLLFFDLLSYLSTLSIEAARESRLRDHASSSQPRPAVTELRDLDESEYMFVERDGSSRSGAVLREVEEQEVVEEERPDPLPIRHMTMQGPSGSNRNNADTASASGLVLQARQAANEPSEVPRGPVPETITNALKEEDSSVGGITTRLRARRRAAPAPA